MSFKVLAPRISARMAERAKLLPKVRQLVQLPDGSTLVARTFSRQTGSCMAVYDGWIVSSTDPGSIESVMVKLSSHPKRDHRIHHECEVLNVLAEMPCVPSVIYQGDLQVLHVWKEEDRVTTSPYFVMPRVEGKNLMNYAHRPFEDRLPNRKGVVFLVSRIFPELAERLAQVHQHGIVHRDVKPLNVIYHNDAGLLYLLDFELANWITAQPRHGNGTVGYSAPEVEKGTLQNEDIRVDVYAYGVTCFHLLTGKRFPIFEGMRSWDEHFGNRPSVVRRSDINDFANQYYTELLGYRGRSLQELVAMSNLPAELKETALGRYLVQLFHPSIEQRPSNMWLVAEVMRRFGGQLLEHKIWQA